MEKNKLYKFGILVLVLVVISVYAYPKIKLFDSKKEVLNQNNDFHYTAGHLKELAEMKNKLNVVLIVLDTVRPDHLSCYGYKRETSPNIDKLAEEGTLFTNAFTVIPYTTASHISLMTSIYPFVYQPRMPNAQATGVVVVEDEYLTLAEILKTVGYKTAAFISVSMMSPASGLNQGFDVYNYSEGVRRGNETIIAANIWLENNYEEPFFLWVHSYDPHDPYNQPKPFDSMHEDFELYYDNVSLSDFTALKQAITNYDEDISYGDKYIGLLLDKIKDLGLNNNTLIVFLSDHGEQFGEHLVPIYQGMGPQVVFEHARALYDQEVRIPFIIKGPGIPKDKKIDALVENIDVMPTILDLLNIPFSKNIQGKSTLPLIKNKSSEIRSFVFTHLYPIISPYYRSSIRTKDYKLIYDHYNKESQLFNLKKDPQEQINIYEQNKTLTQEYEHLMIKLIEEHTESTEIAIHQIESSEAKKLEELGYII
ncbi:MAG: sulfatase-like hydrolase/transferase [Nanoarchaeota archaeon]|nr:sulfatase-like hydrolase/transferase [Nanoarchaeota archaeon]